MRKECFKELHMGMSSRPRMSSKTIGMYLMTQVKNILFANDAN